MFPRGVRVEEGFERAKVRLALCEDSLSEYIRAAWPIIEPNTPYLHNWHIDAIAEHLEAVTAGEIKRLIVNIPPRNMKSISVSVMWPTWEWGPKNRPFGRWLFGSYSASLSLKHSDDRRVIMSSPWYKAYWGRRVRLTKNTEAELVNHRRGHMLASSVGGPPHGKGGNRLVIDDLLDPMQAFSDTERETANRVFDSTYYQRLDNKKEDVIVIVMQRLHEDDVAGHVMKESGWTLLVLPAEAEEKTVITLPRSGTRITRRPKGYTSFRRPGKAKEIRYDHGILWPDREGELELKRAAFRLGSYGYASQYQQSPAPAGGGLIKRKWFRLWKVLPKIRRLIQVWDTAFKEGEENDYSVCQTWAETELGFFLVDQWREKVEMPELKRAALWLYVYWKPSIVLIEDKASGQSLIQELRRPPVEGTSESKMIAPTIPILPVAVDRDKVSKVAAITPLIEGGVVWVPEAAPWLDEPEGFFYECTRFPKAPHDDQVDVLAMALNYLRGSGNMVEFYRQEVERQEKDAQVFKETGELPKPPPNSLVDIYRQKMEEAEKKGPGGSAASVHAGRVPLLPGLARRI